jgi:hypothetical protein
VHAAICCSDPTHPLCCGQQARDPDSPNTTMARRRRPPLPARLRPPFPAAERAPRGLYGLSSGARQGQRQRCRVCQRVRALCWGKLALLAISCARHKLQQPAAAIVPGASNGGEMAPARPQRSVQRPRSPRLPAREPLAGGPTSAQPQVHDVAAHGGRPEQAGTIAGQGSLISREA